MRAITLVKVRSVLPERPDAGLPAFTLLEVTIKTGRTHQIRVHLASQGHPIAGDEKYGDFELNRQLHKHGLKRMFLHAWRLQFNHPASGTRTELLAPLPEFSSTSIAPLPCSAVAMSTPFWPSISDSRISRSALVMVASVPRYSGPVKRKSRGSWR